MVDVGDSGLSTCNALKCKCTSFNCCTCTFIRILIPDCIIVLGLKLFLLVTDADNCANGFLDMDLLTNRATQDRGNGGQVGVRTGTDTLYILVTMAFTCDGTIMSLILRPETRTVTGSLQRTGNSYPTISLWNTGLNDQNQLAYIKVDGSERNIVLDPSNFSTSGVIEYPLDPPIQFEIGNRLAWLQQEEVVRTYLIEQDDFTIGRADISGYDQVPTVIEQPSVVNGPNQVLALYPVTGELMVFVHP